MDVAKQYMEQRGWRAGLGLGRTNEGRTKAIKIRQKTSAKGIGAPISQVAFQREMFSVFENAMAAVAIKIGDEEVKHDEDTEMRLQKQKRRKLHFGMFRYAGILTDIKAKEEKERKAREHNSQQSDEHKDSSSDGQKNDERNDESDEETRLQRKVEERRRKEALQLADSRAVKLAREAAKEVVTRPKGFDEFATRYANRSRGKIARLAAMDCEAGWDKAISAKKAEEGKTLSKKERKAAKKAKKEAKRAKKEAKKAKKEAKKRARREISEDVDDVNSNSTEVESVDTEPAKKKRKQKKGKKDKKQRKKDKKTKTSSS
ncbi:MAG: hypothetical protein MHM6MM_003930 [Cercozoa sp. M6MM]